jgi:hypothetical protein
MSATITSECQRQGIFQQAAETGACWHGKYFIYAGTALIMCTTYYFCQETHSNFGQEVSFSEVNLTKKFFSRKILPSNLAQKKILASYQLTVFEGCV